MDWLQPQWCQKKRFLGSICPKHAITGSKHCAEHSTLTELYCHDMMEIIMGSGNCYSCGRPFCSDLKICTACGAQLKPETPPIKTPEQILRELRNILKCSERENVLDRARAIMTQLKSIAEVARLVNRS